MALSQAQQRSIITMAFTDYQIIKKKKKPTLSFIVGFFTTRVLYKKKINPIQEKFLEDLVFYIAKSYHPL